jgi:alcohol dehydrogenase class IV
MGADLFTLDPALSTSTPERIWLSTGVRSIDRCVETFCPLDPRAAQSEEACGKGLGLLVPILLKTKKDWDAPESRLSSLLVVIEATESVRVGIPLGGSHGIAHQLGPLGVGRVETSCILRPAVLE